jgi:hypothetical protein
MKKTLTAIVLALMLTAMSSQAELRRAEIKVFGMD